MAEAPSSIPKDDRSESEISSKVPPQQEIRDSNTQDIDKNHSSEITVTDYTLSPVITVTKNETTLTKGDMKLQKVTVTEDISTREMEDIDQEDSYSKAGMAEANNKPILSNTDISIQNEGVTKEKMDISEKTREERKSKIPQLKFKQTVEKVTKQKREEKSKEQARSTTRRSSIPKLKDAKLVKRQISSETETKAEETSIKIEAKLEDEFEKIYEEIVDTKQIDIDEKILAVKIDDPEKIETKFDEIIHSYDSNHDSYLIQTEKLRLSKIPWRKKDDEASRIGSLAERVKRQNSVPNNKLKDGGFKVSASTITTKRFSRGNSLDVTNIQKIDVIETIDTKNGVGIIKGIVSEAIKDGSVKSKESRRSYSKEITGSEANDDDSIQRINYFEDNDGISKSDNVETKTTTKETVTRHIKTKIPVKPDTTKRNISKDLNKRPPSLDDKDFVNREVYKYEEIKDRSCKTKETVIQDITIKSERTNRGLNRTFSRDGKSITLSSKFRETNKDEDKTPETELPAKDIEIIYETKAETNIDTEDSKASMKEEVLRTETIKKESVKIGIPVFTKTTHSYGIGNIQTVKMSKTIEWKAADEVITKNYETSYSENISEDNKLSLSVNKGNAVDNMIKERTIIETINTDKQKFEGNDTEESKYEFKDINNAEPNHESKDITVVTASRNEVNIDAYVNKREDAKLAEDKEEPFSVKETKGIDRTLEEDSNTEKVTVLKGNVNRLISQMKVKEDVSRKEIDDDGLPKKKSVLSKIAMFEGKEPTEFSIKIKKCSVDKKTSTFMSKENIVNKSKRIDQVIKTQSELHPFNKTSHVEIETVDETAKEFNNQPVIVDQILKIQNQIVENNLIIHNIEDIRTLPAAIDFTITEDSIETGQILPGKLNFDTNLIQSEAVNTLPIEISSKKDENQVGLAKTLPYQLDFVHDESETEDPNIASTLNAEIDDKGPETAVTLPAKTSFQSNEKRVSAKYLTDKEDQIQTEVQKVRVGKLDLNFWKQQVESNKQYVGTGKQTKLNENKKSKIGFDANTVKQNATAHETPKDLPVNIETKSQEQIDFPITIPNKIEVKSTPRYELPTILPARIDFTSTESQDNMPKVISDVATSEKDTKQLQVPVILPETPLSKTNVMNFEASTRELEIPVILPAKINLSTNTDTVETSMVLSGDKGFINATEDSKILPEQIKDINVLSKTNANNNKLPTSPLENIIKKQEEQTKMLASNKHTNTNNNYVENATILPGKIYFNTQESFNKVENENTRNEIVSEIPKFAEDEDIDVEIPSDPELVDSETEIKETKDTIMGKLKNKIYFIAKANKKKTANTDVINQSNNIQITTQNTAGNIKNNARKQLDAESDIEEEVNIKTRDDLKRAKSLAELDLGDVVKGQVQRMVYRIKSVDFERIETSSSKISVKEMPKKSSVLEKIALFEGKAVSNKTEKPKLQESSVTTTPVPTNVTQAQNITRAPTPEEIYLKKVEDLTTAKVRYGKMEMLYLKLGNGVQIPAIALGTALMEPRLIPHIVAAAIDLGYRAIDTAYIYGNEREVGQGIKMKIDDGTVKREDLFIMSKLWSTYHHPDLVEPACRASLEALGLEYFDLYMIHNPMSFKEGGDPIPKIATVLQFSDYDYLDAWFAMENLVSKGLVRNIGVSNFNSAQIQRILDKGRIRPVVNQVECHPYLSQQELQTYCDSKKITLSCFAVLGSKGTPPEYKNDVPPVIDDPLVKVMASGLNMTAAQLLVRYQIQSGRNVVVKSSSAAHLRDIIQSLTFELNKHEIDAIKALNRNQRIFSFKGMGDTHKNYPFNAAF